jgi:hypothetical protein
MHLRCRYTLERFRREIFGFSLREDPVSLCNLIHDSHNSFFMTLLAEQSVINIKNIDAILIQSPDGFSHDFYLFGEHSQGSVFVTALIADSGQDNLTFHSKGHERAHLRKCSISLFVG